MQVPKLARILALSQSQRALMTISSAAPFGLTNKHMRDLFTPTSLRQRGSIVYRGIGMGFWLYPCESTDTWAISATQDDAAWERCEGHVWLDLATSRARLDAVDRASEAGTYFGFGMERCAHVLETEQSRLAALRSTRDGDVETVNFAQGVTAEQVACTLLWKFGAFTIAGDRAASAVVQLPPDLSKIHLQGDLYLRKGESITIEGMGNSISVGSTQIRVDSGGSLRLMSATIVDSVGGSAIYSEGDVLVTKCTFTKNVANTDLLQRFAEPLVPAGSATDLPLKGTWMGAYGGAVFVAYSKSKFVSRSSIFDQNVALRGRVASWGGAIAARGGYVAIEDGSVVSNNRAEGGSFAAVGGGVFLMFSRFSASNSNFTGNEARQVNLYGPSKKDAGTYANGGGVYLQVTIADISASNFERNVARGGKEAAQGGGLFMQRGSNARIWESAFARNQALDGGRLTWGGGMFLEPGAVLLINTTTIDENVAKGTSESWGGGIRNKGKITIGSGVSFRCGPACHPRVVFPASDRSLPSSRVTETALRSSQLEYCREPGEGTWRGDQCLGNTGLIDRNGCQIRLKRGV